MTDTCPRCDAVIDRSITDARYKNDCPIHDDSYVSLPHQGELTMTDLAIPTIPFTSERGTGVITCERITDTIAITPAINHDNGFTGRFTVSVTTGYRLVEATSCISCARDAAELFTAIDLDWTDLELRHKVTDEQKLAIRHAMEPMRSCTCVGDCVADAIENEPKTIS